MVKTRYLVGFVLVSVALRAQPELLADFNTASTQSTYGLNAGWRSEHGLGVLGGRCVFRGKTAATGEELFVCGPPSFAATLLKDVNPGALGSNPDCLTVVGNKLFFFADDGVHGEELWV